MNNYIESLSLPESGIKQGFQEIWDFSTTLIFNFLGVTFFFPV